MKIPQNGGKRSWIKNHRENSHKHSCIINTAMKFGLIASNPDNMTEIPKPKKKEMK